MSKAGILLGAAIVAGAAVLASRPAQAALLSAPVDTAYGDAETDSEEPLFSWGDAPAQDQPDEIVNFRNHPMLALIQRYESGGRYDILYGGGRFWSYSDHPWADLYEWTPLGVRRVNSPRWSEVPVILSGVNKGGKSTAAGRYQILSKTWHQYRDSFGLPDFAPDSQDRFAFLLMRKNGILERYDRGDFQGAISRAARLWTSLPGSNTGEAQLGMSRALAELQQLRESYQA